MRLLADRSSIRCRICAGAKWAHPRRICAGGGAHSRMTHPPMGTEGRVCAGAALCLLGMHVRT